MAGVQCCCWWCSKETARLTEEASELRSQMEDSAKRGESDSDAMYHLQVAQATLKERYSKLQKKNSELQKHLDQTMMKLVRAISLGSPCSYACAAIFVTIGAALIRTLHEILHHLFGQYFCALLDEHLSLSSEKQCLQNKLALTVAMLDLQSQGCELSLDYYLDG